MKNGVSKLVFAEVLTDTATETTYGPVTPILGLAAVTNKTASNVDIFYADNGAYESTNSTGEIAIELEVADPTNAIMAKLLGHTMVNGVMRCKGSDIPPNVAIGFEGLKTNGKKRMVWLTKGSFSIPDDDYKTKGDKVTLAAMKLSGKFLMRKSDNEWKLIADEDEVGAVPETIKNWLTTATIIVSAPTV